MKWLVLSGFVLAAAGVGTVRFGGWMRTAPVWLDVLFILLAAAAVGFAVSLILVRMHGAARSEWPQHTRTWGEPERPQNPEKR